MPFYSWVGINLQGNVSTGQQFAKSHYDLQDQLIQDEIGLMKFKIINPNFFDQILIESKKTDLINHLATLLNAQVRLPQALKIISSTANNFYLNASLNDISKLVSEGSAFSAAIACHENCFDKLTYSVILAGEKAGNLSKVLQEFAVHCKVLDNLKKQIKSAILIPITTFIFFICILIGIFIFVIPKFESIFSSYADSLPYSTEIILKFSRFLRSDSIWYLLLSLIILAISCVYYLRTDNGKKKSQQLLFKLPIFGRFWLLVYKARFLQTLNILVSGGVLLPEALNVSSKIIDNYVIANEISRISNFVVSGKNLSWALNESFLFNSSELNTFITIGESASDLPNMLYQASELYQHRVYAVVNKITSLIQPGLLILLGLLIAGLVMSIYMPMFTLSNIIS